MEIFLKKKIITKKKKIPKAGEDGDWKVYRGI